MSTPNPIGFSPASVTCFFSPSFGNSPANTYSKGCAINLKQGVTARVEAAPSTQIFFNGKSKSIAPVEFIVQKLAPEPVNILLETSLPLGCGFGLSAASCLSAAFAIVRHYNLNLSRSQIGMLAHEAEVTFKTGLGDVASQLCGGVVFRNCKTSPLDSEQLSLKVEPIYFRVFDELDTSSTLSDLELLNTITEKGSQANDWLLDNINKLTLSDLLSYALTFAQDTHLLTNPSVRSCVNDVLAAGGKATMIMLGQGVLATAPVGDKSKWIKCDIDEQGTRYIAENNRHDGHPH